MDKEEKLAFEYLNFKEFSNIVYEPDGNIPPDFSINKKIAVEVRRLNQNKKTNIRNISLEETQFPLKQKIEKMLSEIKQNNFDKSYFVFFRFQRPLGKVSKIIEEIKRILINISKEKNVAQNIQNYVINDNFNFSIIQATKKYKNLYLMGGFTDYDAGGFVVSEVYRNLKLCIDEKTCKIQSHKSKYEEWWLVFIDYIGYGLSERDFKQLQEIWDFKHAWDKIILLNPLNYKLAREI